VKVPINFDQNVTIDWDFHGAPLDLIFDGPSILNETFPDTSLRIRYFVEGNNYPITLMFHGVETTWSQDFIIRAVSDTLLAPEWIVRDEYGLVGGLFQWKSSSIPEFFELQIDVDGSNFTDPEFSKLIDGSITSYRTELNDWLEGGAVNNWDTRDQTFYNARIRAVNVECNLTSDWATLRFQTDECEILSASFDNGTYNFQKGKFVVSAFTLNDYGTITDLRIRVRGFHQKWNDVGLAVKTPVVHEGSTVDVPLFSEVCDVAEDSGNFDIRFIIGGFDESLCPQPPQHWQPYNDTLVDPWGVEVWTQLVLGQDKRGTWAFEWIDYGIGFPTNGKIRWFETVLCSIPVPPREHIIYKGESKVRRGTVAIYGP